MIAVHTLTTYIQKSPVNIKYNKLCITCSDNHLIKKTLSASWTAIASWPTQDLKLASLGCLYCSWQSISHLCPWFGDALPHSMSLQHPLTNIRRSWLGSMHIPPTKCEYKLHVKVPQEVKVYLFYTSADDSSNGVQ